MKEDMILQAVNDLPEEYVAEAITYQKKKKVFYPWLIAACLGVLFLTGVPQYTAQAVVAEVKQIEFLTQEEALAVQPLGQFYPSVLPEGYVLMGKGIELQQSGTDMLTGWYFNEAYGDTLTVTVAVQSYFGIQTWNLLEPVRNEENIGSRLYCDFGDFAVCYESNTRNLSETEGFAEMFYSSAYFTPSTGGYRMVTSDMYEPFGTVDALGHLSVDSDAQTAWLMIWPLSHTFTGTYTFEDHQMEIELTDTNGGIYWFTYTVITRDVLVLKQVEYNEKASYGKWIEAHLPLESTFYRSDYWSDQNKTENQY